MSRHASYLLFHSGGRRYALAVSDVLRVVPAAEPTPVRNMPPAVHGVINVAGEILPVVDIRVQDGETLETIEPSDRFILTRAAGPPLALLVDGVDGVEELEEILVTLPMEGDAREAQAPAPTGIADDHGQDPARFADLGNRPGTAVVATVDGEIVLIQNVARFISAVTPAAPMVSPKAVMQGASETILETISERALLFPALNPKPETEPQTGHLP